MVIIQTEYRCGTCNKSITIETEITVYNNEADAKQFAAELSSKSPILAAFSQKHSKHQLRQYSELEAIG